MVEQRPVAGYFRVSQARDGMKAPEMYQDEIERYCRYKDVRLGRVFSDIDFSGYRGAKPRPALEDLKARRVEFDAVVIPKLARFGRSVKELVELFDLFDTDGISLVFLDMNIDTSTSQGRLLRHVMAAFAEYESDVKADYARANHRRIRAEGRPWGGTPPVGYDFVKERRTYVINEERAAVVRDIYERYRSGASQYGIARALNEDKTLHPKGKAWRASQIGRILDNPAYAALCVVDDDLIPAVWEPIIDGGLWDAVRAIRREDSRRHRQLRVAKRGPFLLSGLIQCGHCGRKLRHRSKATTVDGSYACLLSDGTWCPGGSIDTARADRFVTDRFLDVCHFVIEGAEDATVTENTKRWEKATIAERRRLLSLAIRRIVLIPWPGRDRPQRQAGQPRELAIEWMHPGPEKGRVALVAQAEPATTPRPKVSNGRADMMRDAEVAAVAKAKADRSEGRKAYFREWAKVQERMRKQALLGPNDGK